MQGSGLRVQGTGYRVQGSGLGDTSAEAVVAGSAAGSEFWVQGSGFRFQGAGCRVQGSTALDGRKRIATPGTLQ